MWIAVAEAIEAGEIRRALVIAPPGHAKTKWLSEVFAAWYVGRHPEQHLICASATAKLAHSISVAVRDTVQQNPDYRLVFPGVVPDMEKGWSESEWFVWRVDRSDKDPTYTAAGVDGPFVGRRADGAILDDPYDEETARSPAKRAHVLSWFRRTFLPRLRRNGWMLVVMTRWVPRDLAQELIDAGWLTVHMPALSEDGAHARVFGRACDVQAIRRRLRAAGFRRFSPLPHVPGPDGNVGFRVEIHPGRALWPEQYPAEALEERRRELGSSVFAAVYQGEPRDEEGALVRRSWFRYFREEGEFYVLLQPDGSARRVEKARCWRFQTCDPAATERERSSWFVLATWAVTPDRDLLLLDVFRERAETTKHEAIMQTQYERWRPSIQVVEHSSYGLAIIQQCKRAGLPVVAVRADRDKVSRARLIAARYEAGAVYHRLGAPWLGEWEDEIASFPAAEHDDQMDVAAYAAVVLAERAAGSQTVVVVPGTSRWSGG